MLADKTYTNCVEIMGLRVGTNTEGITDYGKINMRIVYNKYLMRDLDFIRPPLEKMEIYERGDYIEIYGIATQDEFYKAVKAFMWRNQIL